VLDGKHSDRIKKRALFVLVQIAPAAAGEAIGRILAGDASPALKREAIQTLALAGDSSAGQRLAAYYRTEKDPAGLKRAVIDAGLVGGRTDLVLEVARSESDAELQSHAIRVLGAMGQAAQVAELLPQLTDIDAQRSAVDALAIAGEVAALAGVVRGKGSLPLRLHAVRALSIAGSDQRVSTLDRAVPGTTAARNPPRPAARPQRQRRRIRAEGHRRDVTVASDRLNAETQRTRRRA
jgi:hypothetical protein